MALPGGAPGLSSGAIQLDPAARAQFAHALARVFAAGGIMSVTGFLACFLLPPVSFSRGVPTGAGGQMLTAEMASLEPKSEPELVAADPE